MIQTTRARRFDTHASPPSLPRSITHPLYVFRPLLCRRIRTTANTTARTFTWPETALGRRMPSSASPEPAQHLCRSAVGCHPAAAVTRHKAHSSGIIDNRSTANGCFVGWRRWARSACRTPKSSPVRLDPLLAIASCGYCNSHPFGLDRWRKGLMFLSLP